MSLSQLANTTPDPEEPQAEETTALTTASIGSNMLASVEDAESLDAGFEFPVLCLDNEGRLEPASFMPEEATDRVAHWLRRKHVGIVLAYRTDLVSWPRGYDPDREEQDDPAFTAAAPMSAREDVNLIAMACKAHQFTARDLKDLWDVENGGPGHLKPNLTLVVWDPTLEDVVLLQGHLNYNGFAETRDALRRALGVSGGAAFGCQIQAVKKTIKSWSSGHYAFDLTVRPDSSSQQAFERWTAESDKAEINRWLSCADRPMTDEIRERLQAGLDIYTDKIKPEMDARRNR